MLNVNPFWQLASNLSPLFCKQAVLSEASCWRREKKKHFCRIYFPYTSGKIRVTFTPFPAALNYGPVLRRDIPKWALFQKISSSKREDSSVWFPKEFFNIISFVGCVISNEGLFHS
ncbi:hypothetical protein CEXT_267911 [Caerostris extrusa]|uniref:Uncharacterized protein n=1 Tax=Caerostris extrusa TaxID=172846 RepID=A0AAV4TMN2_CAEEX|nr:hypothetical protein CEXT_267911 [Caerostris extrusa]